MNSRSEIRAMAVVFSRLGKAYVHSGDRTVSGFWVVGSLVETVNATPDEIDASVRRCLLSSHIDVPDPPRNYNGFKEILSAAGQKTWGIFMSGTKCVHVDASDEGVFVVPTVNAGAKEGFVRLVEKARRLIKSDFIGDAVMLAIDVSR